MLYINETDYTKIDAYPTTTSYNDLPDTIKSVIQRLPYVSFDKDVFKFYIDKELVINNVADWVYLDRSNKLCFLDNKTLESQYGEYFYRLQDNEYLVLYKKALEFIGGMAHIVPTISDRLTEINYRIKINVAYLALDLFSNYRLPEPTMSLRLNGEYTASWFNSARDLISIDLSVDKGFTYWIVSKRFENVINGEFEFKDGVPKEIIRLVTQ